MSEIYPENILNLAIVPSDISTATEHLYRRNIGVALLQNVIPIHDVVRIREEVQSIPIETMDDHHTITSSTRRKDFIKNYYEYSLDQKNNDSTLLEEFPRLRALARSVANLVSKDFSDYYQRLQTWQADELKIRHYDRKEGIGYNNFPAHYLGLVAITAINGESELYSHDDYGRQSLLLVEPGDLVLIRSNHLFSPNDPPMFMPEYSTTNISSKEHTVVIMGSHHLGENHLK